MPGFPVDGHILYTINLQLLVDSIQYFSRLYSKHIEGAMSGHLITIGLSRLGTELEILGCVTGGICM